LTSLATTGLGNAGLADIARSVVFAQQFTEQLRQQSGRSLDHFRSAATVHASRALVARDVE